MAAKKPDVELFENAVRVYREQCARRDELPDDAVRELSSVEDGRAGTRAVTLRNEYSVLATYFVEPKLVWEG